MAFGDTGLAGIALHISGTCWKTSSYEGVLFRSVDDYRHILHGRTKAPAFPSEDLRSGDDNHRHCKTKVIYGDGKD